MRVCASISEMEIQCSRLPPRCISKWKMNVDRTLTPQGGRLISSSTLNVETSKQLSDYLDRSANGDLTSLVCIVYLAHN